jgi:hypothetical protein
MGERTAAVGLAFVTFVSMLVVVNGLISVADSNWDYVWLRALRCMVQGPPVYPD